VTAAAIGPAPVGVAAFDFDGTLVGRDSFFPFLVHAVGRRALGRTLMVSGPTLARAFGEGRRDATKAALLAGLLEGYPWADLEAKALPYSDRLASRIRPAMAERVDWHRRQGHRLVIVSAALAVYLEPLGRRLGFDAVLATGLEVGSDGLLTGRLQGPNVRRAEKAVRLRDWLNAELGAQTWELWAYGDSAGDRELLAMADHPRRISTWTR
jgi:phosphatidylglycerophosphatase C